MAVEMVDVWHTGTHQRTRLPETALSHFPQYTTSQPAQTGTAPTYDPSSHNVDDVRTHLAGADDTERQRVLTAERAGKARATILDTAQEG